MTPTSSKRSAQQRRMAAWCMDAENGNAIGVIVQEALAEGKKAPKYHALTRPTTAEAEALPVQHNGSYRGYASLGRRLGWRWLICWCWRDRRLLRRVRRAALLSSK